jgi:hypothetical protein
MENHMAEHCGTYPNCEWEVDVFNEGEVDEHVQITCYSPYGPAEVCIINPDIPLDEAKLIAHHIVNLCMRRS